MPAALVMPMHDPAGVMFPQLFAVMSQLKELFGRAFVTVSPITRANHSAWVDRLLADDFFDVIELRVSLPVGEEFVLLYRHAAAAAAPETILHLCFIDRLAFALQSRYQQQFYADMHALSAAQTPLIFQRSPAAWRTHPRNYRQLEEMVMTVGQMLLGKRLDFTWCHVAVQAGQLQAILPQVKRQDLAVCAEVVLLLHDTMQTQEVDWLAWEDPFIYGRDARQLKREREQSVAEVRKRLAYVLPMLQVLQEVVALEKK